MRALLLCLLAALPGALCAQGTVRGRLADGVAEQRSYDTGTLVGAIALPEQCPPFNELVAGCWQEAMEALSAGRKPETPFGGLGGAPGIGGGVFAPTDSDGRFVLAGLPLERRLAVAARVDGLWRPLLRECWLTAAQPEAEVQIGFHSCGGDVATLVAEHKLELEAQLRSDLKFAPVLVTETLTIENPNPDLAVYLGDAVTLTFMAPPGVLARQLPQVYGRIFIFAQGLPAATAQPAPEDTNALWAWNFGLGDAMHGMTPTYSKGAQYSADGWHALNLDAALDFTGEGETLFSPEETPDARTAAITFRRVVPPARNGKPGRLVLRLRHACGVDLAEPGKHLRLQRKLPFAVRQVSAEADGRLDLSGLVADENRRLFDSPVVRGDRLAWPAARAVDPVAAPSQGYDLVFGFTRAAQEQLAAGPETAAPADEDETLPGARLNTQVLFRALALLFGLAFLGALAASLRKPREGQLERLARLPASRAEVVQALRELKAEFAAGRLPAASYAEQRLRLLNRLIEHDLHPEKP
ncbi:MAG: hypothetical protein IT463_14010 [Planctomycetes bacterium]|nr:hypothetical protein [Planctomycetota bacterium]